MLIVFALFAWVRLSGAQWNAYLNVLERTPLIRSYSAGSKGF